MELRQVVEVVVVAGLGLLGQRGGVHQHQGPPRLRRHLRQLRAAERAGGLLAHGHRELGQRRAVPAEGAHLRGVHLGVGVLAAQPPRRQLGVGGHLLAAGQLEGAHRHVGLVHAVVERGHRVAGGLRVGGRGEVEELAVRAGGQVERGRHVRVGGVDAEHPDEPAVGRVELRQVVEVVVVAGLGCSRADGVILRRLSKSKRPRSGPERNHEQNG